MFKIKIYKTFCLLTCIFSILGCSKEEVSKIQQQAKTNEVKAVSSQPIENLSDKSKSDKGIAVTASSIDTQTVNDVMSFLKSQSDFKFSASESENETDKDGTFRFKNEEYIYFDFKYNPTSKSLTWKQINNSSGGTGAKKLNMVLGHGRSSQMNSTMSLENFSGSLILTDKTICGKSAVELKIQQPIEYYWYDKKEDLGDRSSWVAKTYMGFWGDQMLEGKKLNKETTTYYVFTLDQNMAKRLKPALEDLFKAHGARVSRY